MMHFGANPLGVCVIISTTDFRCHDRRLANCHFLLRSWAPKRATNIRSDASCDVTNARKSVAH
jgi:hypothetical protein